MSIEINAATGAGGMVENAFYETDSLHVFAIVLFIDRCF